MLGEYDALGHPTQETVFLDSLPVAVLRPKTMRGGQADVYQIYADQIDTPRIITRAKDGHIVWRWDGADPFGVSQPIEGAVENGTFSYNPRFPGQLFDGESNNHYNYFRDYDPRTGRYLESDPIGLAGGINTYLYVGGNPITRTDPQGLAWVCQGIAPLIVCRWTPPALEPFDQGFLPPMPAPINPWTQTNTETRTPAFCPPKGPNCEKQFAESVARCQKLFGGSFSIALKVGCLYLAQTGYRRCRAKADSSDGDGNGDGDGMLNVSF